MHICHEVQTNSSKLGEIRMNIKVRRLFFLILNWTYTQKFASPHHIHKSIQGQYLFISNFFQLELKALEVGNVQYVLITSRHSLFLCWNICQRDIA